MRPVAKFAALGFGLGLALSFAVRPTTALATGMQGGGLSGGGNCSSSSAACSVNSLNVTGTASVGGTVDAGAVQVIASMNSDFKGVSVINNDATNGNSKASILIQQANGGGGAQVEFSSPGVGTVTCGLNVGTGNFECASGSALGSNTMWTLSSSGAANIVGSLKVGGASAISAVKPDRASSNCVMSTATTCTVAVQSGAHCWCNAISGTIAYAGCTVSSTTATCTAAASTTTTYEVDAF